MDIDIHKCLDIEDCTTIPWRHYSRMQMLCISLYALDSDLFNTWYEIFGDFISLSFDIENGDICPCLVEE